MLRRNERVLPAKLFGRLCTGIHHQLLRSADELLCSDIHSCLRARVHELLLGRLLELLRSRDVHHCLLGRLVPRLLGRSRSHTLVGFADGLRRRVSDIVRSRLRAEHLLVMPVRLRCGIRSRLLKLFSLLGFAMQHLCVICTSTVQFLFNLHRWIRTRSVPMWFVVRLQLM